MLVHVHGVLMTAWVVLFVTQVWLVSSKRIRLHQRLGYAGIGLGSLIVVVGFVTALRAARYGAASTPSEVSPLAFLAVPLFDLVMFVALFGAAIYYRRRPAEHKRLMLLTAVNFLPPAIARYLSRRCWPWVRSGFSVCLPRSLCCALDWTRGVTAA